MKRPSSMALSWVLLLAIPVLAYPQTTLTSVASDSAVAQLLYLADSLIAVGQSAEAISHLKAALSKDSLLLDARHKLAKVYLWNDKPYEAAVQYEILVRHQPQDTTLLRTLADLYFWTDQEEKGIRVLERLVELRPDDTVLRRKLAQHYSWSGRYHDAVSQLKILLKASPRDTSLLRALKDNLLWAGKAELALSVYRYLLSLAPERNALWLDYARQCAWNEKPAESIRAYEVLRKRQAFTDSTFHEYINVLTWAGKERRAIQELRSWLRSNPRDDWSRWRLAQLLDWNEGSRAEIQRLLIDLLRRKPHHRPALKMYRRLTGIPERRVVTSWHYVTDSNNLTTQVLQSHGVYAVSDGVRILAAAWHRNLTEVRPDTSASMWGEGTAVGISTDLGVRWTLSASLQTTRYRDGWQPTGQQFRMYWLVMPGLSIEAGYLDRESLEGAFGLKAHIREKRWSATWRYEPLRHLMLEGRLARSRLSDGNSKLEAFLNWSCRIRPSYPGVAVVGYIGAEDFEKIYPNSIPYWTPDRLQHRAIGLELDHLVSQHLGLSAGFSVAQSPGYPLSVNLRGSIIVHFSSGTRLLLEYYDFGSRAYRSSTFACRFTADL